MNDQITREVSAQLRIILPELKKSIVESVKRELASEIKNEVELHIRAVKSTINDRVETAVDTALENTMSDAVDLKINRAVDAARTRITTEVNQSQLALVKASHQDIRTQVSRDIANIVKEKIAPQLNNFIMSSAMNNADHTEMITTYRHGVDQNIAKPAREAVRSQYAMAAGRGFRQQNNCALPPPEEKKYTARFVLGDE